MAVDQLAAKLAATGLKVVRLVAKSREGVASSVEALTLHSQVLCGPVLLLSPCMALDNPLDLKTLQGKAA